MPAAVVAARPSKPTKAPAAAAAAAAAASAGDSNGQASSPKPVKPWGSRPAVMRLDIGPRISEVTTHTGTVYLSGQVPDKTRTQGIKSQTAEVLSLIDKHLAAAGTDKTRIVMANCYLSNIEDDLAGFNSAWDAWVPVGQAPPRATVGVTALAHSAWKVEIVVVAAK